MAIFTCSGSGNWNLAATWGGAGVPGNGDQIVIGSGRQVTVSDARIIGTSPVETDVNFAIDLSGSGTRLIIASGGELKVRGNSRMTGGSTGAGAGGSDIEVQAGGIWEFDASQAADPTNQNYYVDVGTGSFEKNSVFRVTGTSFSNMGIVRSNAAGGNGYFKESGNANSGSHDWNYASGLRLGTAAIRAIDTDSLSSTNAVFNIQNCDFEACGEIRAINFPGSPSIRVNNCRFWNSLGPKCIDLRSTNVSPVGVRQITQNSFDLQVNVPHRNLTCDDNLFGKGWDTVNAGQKSASMARNIIRLTNDIKRFGDGSDNYWAVDGSTLNWSNGTYTALADVNNPHWHSADSLGLSATYRETNSIYEDFGSTGDGDIQYPTAVANIHYEHYGCLVLPSQSRAAGNALNAGTMATVNGQAGHLHHFVKCTHYGGGQGFLALAEGGSGFAGMINQLHDNLYWNGSHAAGFGFNYLAYDPTPPGIVTDTITAANCHHNYHFGCRTDGTNGIYNVPSTGVLGANDVQANPQFFGLSNINDAATYKHFYHWVQDITGGVIPGNPSPTNRDFNAWGFYLLSLRNRPAHADFNVDATLENWQDYIRAQYRPTNEVYRAAASDGTTPGAVEMLPPVGHDVLPAEFTLSGVVPVAYDNLPTATLSVTGNTPTPSKSIDIVPVELILQGQAPSTADDIEVPTATFIVSGNVPTAGYSTSPASAEFSLTALAPIITKAIALSPATFTLAGVIPTGLVEDLPEPKTIILHKFDTPPLVLERRY